MTTQTKTTVSTGNNDSSNSVVRVPLSSIVIDRYKNCRSKRLVGDDMDAFEQNIRDNGLISPVAIAVEPEGKYGLVAGFRRTEVFHRLALRPVVEAYNKRHNLTNGDAVDYRDPESRKKVLEAGGEWQQKWQTALENRLISAQIVEVKDDYNAAVLNILENREREDIPLADEMNRIEELIQQYGKTQGEVAKRLTVDKSFVSSLRKIYKMRSYMEEVYFKDLTPLGFSEEKTEAMKKHIEVMLDELDRRMALPKDNDAAVKFSLARDLSNFVKPPKTKEPISTEGVIEALEILTCVEWCGKQPAVDRRRKTPESTLFGAKLREIVEREANYKKAQAAKSEEPAADATASVTVDEIAEAQQAGTATEATTEAAPQTTSAPEVSTGNQAVPAAPAATKAEEPASVSKEDAFAAINEDDDTPSVLTGTSASEEDEDDEEADQVSDGRISRTRVSGPTKAVYNMMDPDRIDQKAKGLIESAFDADKGDFVSVVDRLAFFCAADQLYSVLGSIAITKEITRSFLAYSKAVNQYVDKLEEIATKSVGEEAVKDLKSLIPARPFLSFMENGGTEDDETEGDEFA